MLVCTRFILICIGKVENNNKSNNKIVYSVRSAVFTCCAACKYPGGNNLPKFIQLITCEKDENWMCAKYNLHKKKLTSEAYVSVFV